MAGTAAGALSRRSDRIIDCPAKVMVMAFDWACTAAPVVHRIANRSVSRAAAAKNLASRPVQAAVSKLRLRFGVVSPVATAFEKLGERQRDMNFLLLVRTAGLKQQDLDFGIFAQAVCQHASLA